MGGTEAIVRPICSALVAIVGTFANAMSFSYFAKNRENRDLDFLLMLLNGFDLVVCISAFLVGAVYQINLGLFEYNNPPLGYAQVVSTDIFTAAIQCTGFATCILSSTRFILFWNPFYKVNRLAIKIAVAIYVAIMVVSTVVFDVLLFAKIYSQDLVGRWTQIMDLVNLALILFAVFFFSASTMVLLARKNYETIPGDTAFKDAATTVFILSALFCFLNVLYVITPIMCVTSEKLKTEKDVCGVGNLFQWIQTWIAVPLNSALNPVIYFLRSRNMRQYFWKAISDVMGLCGARKEVHVNGNHTHHSLITKTETTPM